MAKILPGPIVEELFRSVYLRFARSCKNFSEATGNSVLFLTQCVAELFAVDIELAYQQAFLFIRQLALLLRAAFIKKTQENTKEVCSWQFLNCIRLWTKVICTIPSNDNGLGKLAFPLSQIMLGVIALAPSIYYLPLKFHLISCLHQLAAVPSKYFVWSYYYLICNSILVLRGIYSNGGKSV
jgi:nucleolar complex protein 2